MSETPDSPGPGRDDNLPGTPPGPGDLPWLGSPDWTLVPETADWPEGLDQARWEDEDPGDPDEYEDPDNAPPPGLDDAQLAALIAEAREVTAEQARAAQRAARLGHTGVLAAVGAGLAGRRGPGMPGSAHTFPGEYVSRAAGFASGKPLDTAPGCLVLGQFAEDAAGDDDRYPGASDDELLGAVCAWDRVESYASARKHAAMAEVGRRRPAAGAGVDAASGMPEGFDEFVGRELGPALGIGSGAAELMLRVAAELEVGLPGTKAAFLSGVVNREKAGIIAAATGLCDPGQARAAEAMVVGRAGSLTPGGLRAAIARAVMAVPRIRPVSGASTRRSRRGWSGGLRTAGMSGWPGGSCPRPRCSRRISGSPIGRRSCARPGLRATWTSYGRGRYWTSCWVSIPGPRPMAGMLTAGGRTARRLMAGTGTAAAACRAGTVTAAAGRIRTGRPGRGSRPRPGRWPGSSRPGSPGGRT